MKILFYIAAGGRSLPMPNYGIGVVASKLLDFCEVFLYDRSLDLFTDDGYNFEIPSIEYINNETNLLLSGNFDYIAFQIHSANLLFSSLLIEKINNEINRPIIIIGGPGANIVYKLYSKLNYCDYYFFGDASQTLFDLIINGDTTIPNSIYQNKFLGDVSPYLKATNVWNYPDFTRLYPNNNFQLFPFLTTTGCAFNCSFCTSRRDIVGFHSHTNLEDEFCKFIAKYSPKLVRFNDSCINGNRKLFHSLMQLLLNVSPKMEWGAYISLSGLKEEDIDLLSKTNCAYVYLGLESVDPTIREKQNKNYNINNATKIITLLQQSNIDTLLSVIIGLPGETEQSIKNTKDYLLKIKPTAVNVFTYENRPGLEEICSESDFWRQLFGRSFNKRLVPQSTIQNLSWGQIVQESLNLQDCLRTSGILYGENELVKKHLDKH